MVSSTALITCDLRPVQAYGLRCLKYLHEEGCPWDEETYVGALFNDELDILKYLREEGFRD